MSHLARPFLGTPYARSGEQRKTVLVATRRRGSERLLLAGDAASTLPAPKTAFSGAEALSPATGVGDSVSIAE